MNILILKTNIRDQYAATQIKITFDQHPAIKKWSIDIEDVDKVLRIVANDGLSYQEVIKLGQQHNFTCEELMN